MNQPAKPGISARKPRLKREPIPWEVMQELWAKPCAVCGTREEPQVDHIIPVSKGGTSERANLQTLCRWCNGVKGGRLMTNEQIRYRRTFWYVTPKKQWWAVAQ